ncbi:leucine rich repeat containing protein BspA family protein, partial [Entamoeba invadens IP1]
QVSCFVDLDNRKTLSNLKQENIATLHDFDDIKSDLAIKIERCRNYMTEEIKTNILPQKQEKSDYDDMEKEEKLDKSVLIDFTDLNDLSDLDDLNNSTKSEKIEKEESEMSESQSESETDKVKQLQNEENTKRGFINSKDGLSTPLQQNNIINVKKEREKFEKEKQDFLFEEEELENVFENDNKSNNTEEDFCELNLNVIEDINNNENETECIMDQPMEFEKVDLLLNNTTNDDNINIQNKSESVDFNMELVESVINKTITPQKEISSIEIDSTKNKQSQMEIKEKTNIIKEIKDVPLQIFNPFPTQEELLKTRSQSIPNANVLTDITALKSKEMITSKKKKESETSQKLKPSQNVSMSSTQRNSIQNVKKVAKKVLTPKLTTSKVHNTHPTVSFNYNNHHSYLKDSEKHKEINKKPITPELYSPQHFQTLQNTNIVIPQTLFKPIDQPQYGIYQTNVFSQQVYFPLPQQPPEPVLIPHNYQTLFDNATLPQQNTTNVHPNYFQRHYNECIQPQMTQCVNGMNDFNNFNNYNNYTNSTIQCGQSNLTPITTSDYNVQGVKQLGGNGTLNQQSTLLSNPPLYLNGNINTTIPRFHTHFPYVNSLGKTECPILNTPSNSSGVEQQQITLNESPKSCARHNEFRQTVGMATNSLNVNSPQIKQFRTPQIVIQNVIKKETQNGTQTLTSVTAKSSTKFRSVESNTSELTNMKVMNLLKMSSITESYLFGCTDLTSVCIPLNITEMRSWCFACCGSLKRVVIMAQLSSLPPKAFFQCSDLSAINIPNTVTAIGNYCFSKCHSIRQMTLPYNIKVIGGSCFMDCSQLTSMSIPSTVSSLNSSTFEGCEQLQKIELSENVKEVGNECFKDCKSLKEVDLSNVTTLTKKCFENCYSLETANVGRCERFEENAFRNCVVLKLSINEMNVKVARNCFENCPNVEFVNIEEYNDFNVEVL